MFDGFSRNETQLQKLMAGNTQRIRKIEPATLASAATGEEHPSESRSPNPQMKATESILPGGSWK